MFTIEERRILLTCDGRGKEAKTAILERIETENIKLEKTLSIIADNDAETNATTASLLAITALELDR